MNSEQWRVAWRILNAATTLPPGDQRSLVELESVDPEVRQRVFELLQLSERDEPDGAEPTVLSRTGAEVGRHLVCELLGRGGMGEVYAARDLDLERQVAQNSCCRGASATRPL
jgi:serine/threonine protein kinase